MLKSKLRSLLFILGLSLLIINSMAYIPENNTISVLSFSDAEGDGNIETGVVVNVTVVIRNYTNDTMNNVTITQVYAKDSNVDSIQLINSPYGEYNGGKTNHSDITIKDAITNNDISVNYLNITAYNFTMNVPAIVNGSVLSFSYSLNFTDEGTFVIDRVKLKYFDYWGDENSVNGLEDLSIDVLNIEPNPIRPFIPEFDTVANDYTLIIGLMLGTIFIALIARVLYFQKPFEM